MANPFEIDWQKPEAEASPEFQQELEDGVKLRKYLARGPLKFTMPEIDFHADTTLTAAAVKELRAAGEPDLANLVEACGGPETPPPRMLHLAIRPQELVTLFGSLQRKQAFAVLAIERGWGDDEITIPADVRVTCAHYDFQRDAFLIRCEHPTFPEVGDGCVIPAYCVRLQAELVENLKPKE